MDNNAPLYRALKTYIHKNKIPFHMPGHKQGKGILERFKEDIFTMDLTELSDTDNLHAPEGSIQEAHEMAAKAFGAKNSFFLVNGSTCGIQTMIASICNPGDTLIVDRNCHSAVIHGLILCGVTPQFVYPQFVTELGIVGGMNPDLVGEILQQYPDAKGVLITSPTYYGICSDLTTIANIVHAHNKILLVDEAHGAHFCFHNDLPECALASGADMCVQSAHKTLPALTQSAFLHIKSDKVDLRRVRNALKLFQSSSPSYILMAYLDVARYIMQSQGELLLDNLLLHIKEAKEEIYASGKASCLGTELKGKHNIHDIDMTRLVLHFGTKGANGYNIANQLQDKYDIQVEMADIYNIVCILTIADTREELKALVRAVNNINFKNIDIGEGSLSSKWIRSQYAIDPRIAFFSESERVDIKDANGCISAETVVCFPPGVPILCPGEIISDDIVTHILQIMACGGKILGLNQKSYIRVVKNN